MSGNLRRVVREKQSEYKDTSAKKAYIEKSEITIPAIDILILLLVYLWLQDWMV